MASAKNKVVRTEVNEIGLEGFRMENRTTGDSNIHMGDITSNADEEVTGYE